MNEPQSESDDGASRDDEALLRRAVDGDERALETLVARHLPALRAYVRLRQGPLLSARESSSDVVQSVCRELIAGLDRITWRGQSAFRAWLYTAARRKLADRAAYLGAARRDVRREEQVAPDDDDAGLLACYASVASPSGVAMGRELLTRIEDVFARLPDDYREVIVLSRVVGLERAEVAAQMERSEGSIRNLLSRALARLAEELESD